MWQLSSVWDEQARGSFQGMYSSARVWLMFLAACLPSSGVCAKTPIGMDDGCSCSKRMQTNDDG